MADLIKPTAAASSEFWEVALRRANKALAKIADNQMNTWNRFPSGETPRDIIARQIVEAMNDAVHMQGEPASDAAHFSAEVNSSQKISAE